MIINHHAPLIILINPLKKRPYFSGKNRGEIGGEYPLEISMSFGWVSIPRLFWPRA